MLRSLRTVALAGAATVAGAALVLGALDTKPAKAEGGGTLIWSIPAAMSLFDPPQSCGWLTKNATHMIFDGLVELELGKPEKGWATLRPALAESWTVSEDGMTYTFNLRKGVKFHDGTPFNAEVAKWNYDRFSNPDAPQYNSVANAYLNFYARWIASTRVVDEHTFEIVLTQPHYEWLQIGQSSCGQPEMISPTAWEIHGDQDIALHPVGTGPFKFVEREIDVMVVLERNDDYYGEPAKLDYMVYRQDHRPGDPHRGAQGRRDQHGHRAHLGRDREPGGRGLPASAAAQRALGLVRRVQHEAPGAPGRARPQGDQHGDRP